MKPTPTRRGRRRQAASQSVREARGLGGRAARGAHSGPGFACGAPPPSARRSPSRKGSNVVRWGRPQRGTRGSGPWGNTALRADEARRLRGDVFPKLPLQRYHCHCHHRRRRRNDPFPPLLGAEPKVS